MKNLSHRRANRIQPIPSSLLVTRLLRVIYSRGRASTLIFISAALLAQPCAATPTQWEYTGSLNIARFHHTATLFPDGRVLVVGGEDGRGALTSAELYDPATGIWSATGSLNQGRADHTATLLRNAMVLVAGGAFSHSAPLASAELYRNHR